MASYRAADYIVQFQKNIIQDFIVILICITHGEDAAGDVLYCIDMNGKPDGKAHVARQKCLGHKEIFQLDLSIIPDWHDQAAAKHIFEGLVNSSN